jgi:ketosteroid isomerase-like protein
MPWILALLALVLIMPADAAAQDVELLEQLNADYIDSVQTSNVKRFDEILADDFRASLPDGSLLDRAQFLAFTAKPVTISRLEAHEVLIRVIGEVAIIHARTTYTLADGSEGRGRYTDIWAKRGGRWLCVAAHVTRN